MPTALALYYDALRWTWKALIAFVITGLARLFLAGIPPISGILSVIAWVLAVIAFRKTARAYRSTRGTPRG
jgi:membrane protein implicated in regulation of membrane protease activity